MLRLVDLDRHASGDGASNLFLNVEQIREFDIEAIGPKHAFGCRIDEFNRDPKALVGLAQTAAENVADAKALPNRFGGIGFEIEQKGRVTRDHHEIAEPGETADYVLGDPFAKMIVA